jgi:DNA repair protein RecN (Recombination protein N)
MLTHIHIKNFTIIDQLELELDSGLTVLTGETGAGKSIVIDAIELALGARTDTQVIRQNSERCEITASFALNHAPAAQAWLIEHELHSEDECIIQRIINRDGRSRSLINGQACTLQMVRELGTLLINTHNQHQHQALLKTEYQRHCLDAFANHFALCKQVQQLFQQWRKLQIECESFHKQTNDKDARIELLKYQVQELEQLALTKNELPELEQEHKQLSHSEQLIQQCQTALNIINEDEKFSVLSGLYQALQPLEKLQHLDKAVRTAAELLNNAIIQTEEANNELQGFLDGLELNPERLAWIEQRLNTIHDLARKHHCKPQELSELQQQLQQQLNQFEHADEQLQKMQQQLASYQSEYENAAQKLSLGRQAAAKKLSTLVTEKIQKLGMPQGKFSIQLEQDGERKPRLHGYEEIEFSVTANPGQPLQALNKVASGGELSRISLAIHVITAEQETTPTLIFDEVDVGVGGSIAEIIGQLLRELGKNNQVLCITHLPQVAAHGHQHLQVKKHLSKNDTTTQIEVLSSDSKVAEIARMLGGVTITERTLEHAKEMINSIL